MLDTNATSTNIGRRALSIDEPRCRPAKAVLPPDDGTLIDGARDAGTVTEPLACRSHREPSSKGIAHKIASIAEVLNQPLDLIKRLRQVQSFSLSDARDTSCHCR